MERKQLRRFLHNLQLSVRVKPLLLTLTMYFKGYGSERNFTFEDVEIARTIQRLKSEERRRQRKNGSTSSDDVFTGNSSLKTTTTTTTKDVEDCKATRKSLRLKSKS